MMENKLQLKNDGVIFKLDSIERDFQRLYDHYRAAESANNFLREENAKLKSEAYKDEELSKMKAKYDKMEADYRRGFPITEEEDEKICDWIDGITKNDGIKTDGAIGGRFTYSFTPTGIGTIITVTDSITKNTLTIYDDF